MIIHNNITVVSDIGVPEIEVKSEISSIPILLFDCVTPTRLVFARLWTFAAILYIYEHSLFPLRLTSLKCFWFPNCFNRTRNEAIR